MLNKLIIYCSLILLSLWQLSFQWPLEDGKITSSYCESRADHFHDGIDMASSQDKIYPIDNGKLIYYWSKSVFPLDIHPGGGNYIVLKHTNNLYSIYMHLDDGGLVKDAYTSRDPLGKIGSTGHSYARHLHLSILDAREKSSINPLTKLAAYKDEKTPVIGNILVKIQDKYVRLKDQSDIRLTKHYPLLIEIVDSAQGREKMGIYKLEVALNDKNIFNVTFDKLQYSPLGLHVSNHTFENLFDEQGFYQINSIKYAHGENNIKISATDFAGNKADKTYTINVKLDLK